MPDHVGKDGGGQEVEERGEHNPEPLLGFSWDRMVEAG